MPKLIDYPRTSYTGAWEIAEVVDDTGGKCALETAARKLNRKVSGSFKAIVGSAVKYGLLTSKREMLTTTTLFRRIKHAYDKQEELLFHREAFLMPPLFTQLCRKFRSRELPVAMLDVLLIREFDVEEINAQTVAKAFVDGARMVGLLDEQNTMADIDQLNAQQVPRRELASPTPNSNQFRASLAPTNDANPDETTDTSAITLQKTPKSEKVQFSPNNLPLPSSRPAPATTSDAIASLFGLNSQPVDTVATTDVLPYTAKLTTSDSSITRQQAAAPVSSKPENQIVPLETPSILFQLQLTGPGLNTSLDVVDADDLNLVRALLDKIERQLRR